MNPSATPAQVKSAILSSAEDGYAGQGSNHTEPMLDVAQLLQ